MFAGGFLLAGRDFNRAVDDYCALVGLPPGLIENVTDGTNAYLVAIDSDGRLLATEEAIVDAARPNRIRDIFLVDRPLAADEIADIEARRVDALQVLDGRQPRLVMNPRVAEKIASAALIIYGPGTQHSSLFPSYLTPGLGDAIAGNLDGDEGARHEPAARRRDHRQQCRRSGRARGLLSHGPRITLGFRRRSSSRTAC